MSSKLSLSRKGFTLVELLVVIAIIGILVGMILPAVQAAREAARRTTCLNNVKQVALATINYEATNSRFPAAVSTNGESFLVRILPMLEQKPLYDNFRAGNQTLATLATVELEPFRCASASTSDFESPDGGFTSHYTGCSGYTTTIGNSAVATALTNALPTPSFFTPTGGFGNLGLNGLFSPRTNVAGDTLMPGTKSGVTTSDVTDGMSNTMSVIETSRGDFSNGTANSTTFTNERHQWSYGQAGADTNTPMERVNWSRSVDFPINSFDAMTDTARPYHQICISSEHSGGANVANGDGSIHFVSEDTDLTVLQSVAGVEDSQTADLDD